MKRKRANYDALIRFRCHSLLILRLERIASEQKRDPADMYRLAMEEYADEKEKKLKLPPITEASISFPKQRKPAA